MRSGANFAWNRAVQQGEGVTMRWSVAVVGAAIGLSALMIGVANAEPTPQPAPGPATTSTSDELADMVMDAIQHGGASPTTTPVPAPPR
jgi:hypothetical protein